MTTTRETWTLPRDWKLDATEWAQCPVDAGQIADVTYCLWRDGAGGGTVVRRTHDRSAGEVSLEAAESGGEFEPWNGDVGATGPWLPLAIG